MGDGAMCHYCRKYQCECHLSAEEWRERCKNAEEEVARLKEALQDSTTVRNEFLSRFEKASAEVSRLTRFQQNVAAACMKMYDDLIYFRRAIEVHLEEFGDEARQQKERG